MVPAHLTLCAVLELVVMAFQVIGVAGLCLSRLVPTSRWSGRGKVVFLVAMVGLGVAGALCGRHDSEFALFAGGTMTALLIGMTMGSGAVETTGPAGRRIVADATLVG